MRPSIPCVLMCHAPIVLPEIAGGQLDRVSGTTQAMQNAAAWLARHQPRVVVLCSPHAPRARDAFRISINSVYSGSFGDFGFPEISFRQLGDPELAQELVEKLEAVSIPVEAREQASLDHGALVPLYFLKHALWDEKLVVVSFPERSELSLCQKAGAAIREVLTSKAFCSAAVASGDMSHRLSPDAPSGFHPHAAEFDREVRAAIEEGHYSRALQIRPSLRAAAGEDFLESLAFATGVTDHTNMRSTLLSYEAPFGVGYLVARLEPKTPPNPLLQVAREAVEGFVHRQRRAHAPHLEEGATPRERSDVRGVFVTIWKGPEKQLRGCIGRFERRYDRLEDEIADCARLSASADGRFTPITQSELPQLEYEISLLGALERVASPRDLDPLRWGVVVQEGERQGTLLPNVDGVDTVEDQIAIARRKAGIAPEVPVELFRYPVEKIAGPEKG